MNDVEIDAWENQNNRSKSEILSNASALDGIIGNHLSYIFTFNDEDKKKFHEIFFEPFVSFNTKISQYRKFLELFIPDILGNQQLRTIFNDLDYFKRIRNIFAHSMNPLREVELRNTELMNMPFTKVYKWENSEMIPYTYSNDEIIEIERRLLTLKQLLALIDVRLRQKSEELKNKIKTEN